MQTRAEVAERLRVAGCVFADDEAALICEATTTAPERERMVSARADGAPLEHLLGWAQFRGQRFAVSPGVFVPRHRSEFLVECALAVTPAEGLVVDLCCGTGALGRAIAAAVPSVELVLADIDPAAADCASRNVSDIGGTVFVGDLFDALPESARGRVNVLVVNAPYVPTAEIRLLPSEARVHENPLALDGGADGLDLHRRVAAGARDWLAVGGHLLAETSRDQALTLAAEYSRHGLKSTVQLDPELGGAVVVGER